MPTPSLGIFKFLWGFSVLLGFESILGRNERERRRERNHWRRKMGVEGWIGHLVADLADEGPEWPSRYQIGSILNSRLSMHIRSCQIIYILNP